MTDIKLDIYCSPKELSKLEDWCAQEVPQKLAVRLLTETADKPEVGTDEAPSLVFKQGVLSLKQGANLLSSELPSLFDFWLKQRSRNDLLARALGIYAQSPTRQVFDATFGLGKDAMNMLAHGVSVVACERNPWLFLLGLDGRRRLLARNPELLGRFDLKYADLDFEIEILTDYPVLYLDPMFEDKNKRLAKKEMQLIQSITRETAGLGERYKLLEQSLKLKSKRVVFKGPVNEKLEGLKPPPSSSFVGKTVRYSLFLT